MHYANKVKRHNVRYWEIGNENYGTWEADNNTRPHDPVTYANRFKEYWRQMKAVDPSIKIGAVVVLGEDAFANYTDHPVTNPRTGQTHNGWTPVMLDTLQATRRHARLRGLSPLRTGAGRRKRSVPAQLGLELGERRHGPAPDARRLPGSEGASASSSPVTEHNSVFSNPGKQTTSLVNGLFYADAMGNLLKTEFNAMLWWDLRNGQEARQQQQLPRCTAGVVTATTASSMPPIRRDPPTGIRPSTSTNYSSTLRAAVRRWCRQAVTTAASASTR